jgi:hypothetical protein
MSELICIGNATTVEPCTARVMWCRTTQFAGDHHFCDEHARAEKDFGQVDAPGAQFIWFWRDQITQTWMPVPSDARARLLTSFEMRVDKPFSVREFIDRARAAGHDALGIANDPEAIALIEAGKGVTSLAAAAKARELINAPIDHRTRQPNQPLGASIVEGDFDSRTSATPDSVPYVITLTRAQPGLVEFTLKIDGKICGRMPFDNLVKAATRIDPDHAVGPEKQIQKLRRETAEAKAQMYDWQAKAVQLEEQLRAFQEASKV